MNSIFPEPIKKLPKADVPLNGITAYMSQTDTHQILFCEFESDTEIQEHSHKEQYAVVLEGRIDLVIEGKTQCFTKGDRYFIPAGIKHSAKIYAGYADITFFNEPHRYPKKDINKL